MNRPIDTRCQHFVRYGIRCSEEGRYQARVENPRKGRPHPIRLCHHHAKLQDLIEGKV